MRLDVGCGNRPTGDVNVDLYPEKNPYRKTENIQPITETKKIPNFIRSDAFHLPFKDGCFGEVVSNSVLEHVDDFYGNTFRN